MNFRLTAKTWRDLRSVYVKSEVAGEIYCDGVWCMAMERRSTPRLKQSCMCVCGSEVYFIFLCELGRNEC